MIEEVKSIILERLDAERIRLNELEKKQNNRIYELKEKLERITGRSKEGHDCGR